MIGIDLGKLFPHAQGGHGHDVWRKRFTRAQLPTSLASYAARTLSQAPDIRHRVLPTVPQFARPFVKGSKSDFDDADAI
ncbi:hypothetical protein [Paraburkholderia heleia]|uniref:hypothetical protein n=1 Tax=Paraburkholderia heleia TaxID=634127 RepID=UPI0012ED73BE